MGKPISMEVQVNRARFLAALRSGEYKKGTILSDEKGLPITTSDDDGYCACAIMVHLFPGDDGKESIVNGRRALGLSADACGYIQREINDTPLSFPQMADRIESEVFKTRNNI